MNFMGISNLGMGENYRIIVSSPSNTRLDSPIHFAKWNSQYVHKYDMLNMSNSMHCHKYISGSMIRLEIYDQTQYFWAVTKTPCWLIMFMEVYYALDLGDDRNPWAGKSMEKPRYEGTTGDGTNTVHNDVCLSNKNVWDILLCPSKLIAVHVLVAFVCDIPSGYLTVRHGKSLINGGF